MNGPEHLFVYGTLRHGDVRWPILEPFVEGHGRDDRVAGRLFDTGLGYPAARFAEHDARADRVASVGAADVIVGTTHRLVATRLDEALDVLDDVEGTVAGLFRRVVVTTQRGVTAWSYAYGDGLHLTPIDGGDWFGRPAPGSVPSPR